MRVPPERNSPCLLRWSDALLFFSFLFGRGSSLSLSLSLSRRPGRTLYITHDAPSLSTARCFLASLNVPRKCVPPTWLAPGIDQGPSVLLPAWYQFWPLHAAPPLLFQTGTEDQPISVPGHSSNLDSFKRRHIHAAPPPSMPARPCHGTPLGDPHVLQ